MIQILEKEPSFGSQMGRGLGKSLGAALTGALQGYSQKKQSQQENESFKKLFGIDLSGMTPEVKQEFAKQFSKAKAQEELIKSMFGKKPPLGVGENKVSSEGESIDLSEIGEEGRTKLSMINPSLARQLTEENKLSFKKQQAKESSIDKSYEAQKDFINDVTNSYKGFETEMKPRLSQMQKLGDDELIGPTAAKFLEYIGIPLGALENPASELYSKLSQDLLKGLPETYGNRILKVEVDNFLKTIPTLMNSPDGRRMIASNMLKLGEIKEAYYKEMRRQQVDYLDKNQKFPKDFEQRVFDNALPRINKLNEQFVKLSEVKAVPPGTIPFFNPQGEITFVPKEHAEWAIKNGGQRIW